MAQSSSTLREIRTRLGLSQSECAVALGVALETYRAWDAGRSTVSETGGEHKPAPQIAVAIARELAGFLWAALQSEPTSVN